jgi:hypothetical protein
LITRWDLANSGTWYRHISAEQKKLCPKRIGGPDPISS